MKDTIGLIHPSSVWHKDSAELRGQEIVILDLQPCITIKGYEVKGLWYFAEVKLVNPPEGWECIAKRMAIYGFRPRGVK